MINKTKLSIMTAAILGTTINMTSVHAIDLLSSNSIPLLIFNDTSFDAPNSRDWVINGEEEEFSLQNYVGSGGGDSSFLFNTVLRISDTEGNANNHNSLVIDTEGDISLADETVFIRKNTTDPRLGIGTITPEATLDVAGDIHATFSGDSPTSLQQLFIMSANNTDSGKKSDAGFILENARENFSYAFRTLEKFTRPGETTEIDGGFAISKQATGAQELVLINPTTNDPSKVELHLSSGASNVDGQWENASSRSYKKNIHELSGEDAMQAMRGLTSVTYQFKTDKGNSKMIGFIAEDIPELLATKTRKTVDSLRIVAVLTKAMQEQDKETAELKAKNTELTQRLAALERLVINLAAGNGALPSKGKKVVLNK